MSNRRASSDKNNRNKITEKSDRRSVASRREETKAKAEAKRAQAAAQRGINEAGVNNKAKSMAASISISEIINRTLQTLARHLALNNMLVTMTSMKSMAVMAAQRVLQA